ncbi:MAG: transposase [Thermoplasmata archaeon]
MDKKVKGEDKLSIANIRRNLIISKKRLIVERPYAVIKSVFHRDHVLITTVIRVRVKAMFMCLACNLFIVLSLHKTEDDSVGYKKMNEKNGKIIKINEK